MRERCHSARFSCVARLVDHRLAFTRRSRNRGCGVGDAVLSHGNNVWGVVYEIDETELPELDRREGVNSGAYVRRDEQTIHDRNGGQAIQASIYFANQEQNPPLPNAEYKRLIVGGARFWGLPDGYIEELERIETLG